MSPDCWRTPPGRATRSSSGTWSCPTGLGAPMQNLKVGTGLISALVYRPDGSALVALDVDHPTTRARVFPSRTARARNPSPCTGRNSPFRRTAGGRPRSPFPASASGPWVMARSPRFNRSVGAGFCTASVSRRTGHTSWFPGNFPGTTGPDNSLPGTPTPVAAWVTVAPGGIDRGRPVRDRGRGQYRLRPLKSDVLFVESRRVAWKCR